MMYQRLSLKELVALTKHPHHSKTDFIKLSTELAYRIINNSTPIHTATDRLETLLNEIIDDNASDSQIINELTAIIHKLEQIQVN